MKKLFYYTSLLITVLLISSYSNANSITSPTPSISSTPSMSSITSLSSMTSTSSTPSYFGNWTVHKVIGSTPISANVNEGFIGMKATYTKEKASIGKVEILNPEYKESEITNEDFYVDYRNRLSDIGIKSNSVKTVKINNSTTTGSFLFIKDDQTMIFLWDGNYYEMKRE